MTWEAGPVRSSRGVDTPSPGPQPPAPRSGLWFLGVGKSASPTLLSCGSRAERNRDWGRARSCVRGAQAGLGVSDEGDSVLLLWPEAEGRWHVRGRWVRASALAPSSPGHPPWASWSTLTHSGSSSELFPPWSSRCSCACLVCTAPSRPPPSPL